MRTRICVIGAGPGGLGVMRALQSLNESDYEVVCYERYDTTGGQWNFKYALYCIIYYIALLFQLTRGELYSQLVSFVQSILADPNIRRRELRLIIKKPCSVEYGIKKIFLTFIFYGELSRLKYRG